MPRTDSSASDPAAPAPLAAALRDLSGVGPKILEKLRRLRIERLDHLLLHLPKGYEDRTRLVPLDAVQPGQRCLVEGVVQGARVEYFRGRRLRVQLGDDSLASLELLFMRFTAFQKNQLAPGTRVRCFGEVKLWRRTLRMFHPEYELVTADEPAVAPAALTPLYPATTGLAQVSLRKLIQRALAWAEAHPVALEHPDWERLFRARGLPGFLQALRRLHVPEGEEGEPGESDPARQRLIMEELAAYLLVFDRLKHKAARQEAAPIAGGEELIQALRAGLPFALTGAQDRVIAELRADLARDQPMMRLLQGDVGSGKTLVAAAAALCAVASDMQVAVMAPTELLAEQHYRCFRAWLEPMQIEVVLLSSSLGRKAKEHAKQRIRAHQARIVVGTHALIQKTVEFDRLGLLIIDEQQRFGVHQRLALRRKGESGALRPHQLIMTATPIPRSLAMTFYGELDSSVLDELPPGRKPVATVAMSDERRSELMLRIREACLGGQQAYWVCTLIEESDVLQCEAATSSWEHLRQTLPELSVGLVHGQMKAADKEQVIRQFRDGAIQLLVATKVIEVGVDVPNASLMVIENAERLGLAQLHQLRGRVGRGARQSTCVLLYKPPLPEAARERIRTMRETTDGFEIARCDLRLRGPGQLLGARQAGEKVFRVADLTRDERLLEDVRRLVREFAQASPAAMDAVIERWLGESRELGSV